MKLSQPLGVRSHTTNQHPTPLNPQEFLTSDIETNTRNSGTNVPSALTSLPSLLEMRRSPKILLAPGRQQRRASDALT